MKPADRTDLLQAAYIAVFYVTGFLGVAALMAAVPLTLLAWAVRKSKR